jgi:SAM-dependent methyltransferase
MPEYHEQNRRSWNAATQRHHEHKQTIIDEFKNGFDNLYREDYDLLGELDGKKVAHLQCNDGRDTISMARHGADVTGIDISDYAIDFARKLSEETGIPATFVRSDIFEWFEQNDELFDIVYTSYGAICWLSDLSIWAQGIARTLKPGGKFVFLEFHPATAIFGVDWSIEWPYMSDAPIPTEGVGDYVGNDYEGAYKNPHTAYEFAHGIGDVVTALLNAGLTLTHLKEYPYITGWKRFPDMQTRYDDDGKARHYGPPDKPQMAYMFSVIARKPDST